MDKERRDALVQLMQDAQAGGFEFSLVTLEEFFFGNDQMGSICPHVTPQPSPPEVMAVFEVIRGHPAVAGVYVMPTQIDDDEDWPFSDTVWIITSLSVQELEEMVPRNFCPSEWIAGWPTHYSLPERPVPLGMRPLAAWYD